jgi:hypothetical protein
VGETKIARRPAGCEGTRGRLVEYLSREGWVKEPGYTAIFTHDVETRVGEETLHERETIVSAVLYKFDPPLMDRRSRCWHECRRAGRRGAW